MAKIANIKALLSNELKFEFKNKQSIGSIFLYVFTSTFLAYLSFKVIDSPKIWNGIFWIILLFSAINSTMNSFKESQGQHAYLYSLVSPQEIILSKIIYNALVLLVVSLLCLTSYSLFLGSYISDVPLFVSISATGSIALACILTLSAGISYKASGGGALFSILSIPIVIPLLVLMITASVDALKNTQYQSFLKAEMYTGEQFNIKAELTSTLRGKNLFTDEDNKQRVLAVTNTENLNVGNAYVISGTYFSENNFYEITQVIISNKKDTFGAWIKTASILLISLLLITISYLIFPKFWKE
ncbi:MAG: heme exporter protein B [Saprospiraceae bacterium]|jgi:heme exporter protein B